MNTEFLTQMLILWSAVTRFMHSTRHSVNKFIKINSHALHLLLSSVHIINIHFCIYIMTDRVRLNIVLKTRSTALSIPMLLIFSGSHTTVPTG